MSPDPTRLFLSYGRADASELTDRLSVELSGRGYSPWQDTSELRGGASWSAQIVAALRSSRAMIAILSPHSVRSTAQGATDDSVCLDEIAMARFDARIPIIPVMSVAPPCAVPFEIYRIHYIDLSRWKESEDAFRDALGRLVESIEARLRGEPAPRTWVDYLEPQDFGDYLAERRASFTGRQWLLSSIEDWRLSPNGRSMLLTAPPGFGKTAVVAELVHRNPGDSIVAYHCCRADDPESRRPGVFVRSIAAMMAARLPSYAAKLAGGSFKDDLGESAAERDPERAFEKAILEPLRQIDAPSGGPRLVLIDGLDEAVTRRGRQRAAEGLTILSLLQRRVSRLPTWLRLLATARHERVILDALAGISVIRLDKQDAKRNSDDVAQFISSRLCSPPVAAMAGPAWNAEKFSADLSARAAGNFLYATLAVKAIEEGRISLTEADALPPDLPGIYGWFFERHYAEAALWEKSRRLFDILTAARDELSTADIRPAFGGHSEAELAEILESASPFLRTTATDPPAYSLYHRSLGEWLVDPKRAGGVYTADPAAGHRALADGLWALYSFDIESLPEYGLRHLAAHLEAGTRAQDPQVRQASIDRLLDFVLDPSVHYRLEDDPALAHGNFALALGAVVDGPPVRSAPLALRVAVGLTRFRRERLNPARLFEIARRGEVERFEKELDLFEVENPWREAAKLIAAWLARNVNPSQADRLLRQASELSRLRWRVSQVFDNRPPPVPDPPEQVDGQTIDGFLAQLGGMDLDGRRSTRYAEPTVQPEPGNERSDEAVRFLAEDHAPALVSWARIEPERGTRQLKDYIGLQAANGYRTYRNEALWRMVPAVLKHPDEAWVLEILQVLASGALAGGGWEFVESARTALSALRAAADPARVSEFERRIDDSLVEASKLRPAYGQGDAWGEHRLRLAAAAESLAVVHGAKARALSLLDTALNLPGGFAGFQVSASITLADALRICGGAPAQIAKALSEARVAAHNIQDAAFCARTTARCNAMIDEWASASRLDGSSRMLRETVARFSRDRRTREFSTLHYAGWTFEGRRGDWRSAVLPAWLLRASTIDSLALAFQRPLEDFMRLNPGFTPGLGIEAGAAVRVPDAHFASWLAARFSAEALVVSGLPREERLRIILRLLPAATTSVTQLDRLLSRLLLALRPRDPAQLDEIERQLNEGFPAPSSPVSGVE